MDEYQKGVMAGLSAAALQLEGTAEDYEQVAALDSRQIELNTFPVGKYHAERNEATAKAALLRGQAGHVRGLIVRRGR